MKTKLLILVVAMLAAGGLALGQDTNFAVRLACEMQTAGPASLADLTWQQGTTPHVAVSPLRLGRPIAVDPLTTVRMIIGQSGMVTNYALATNWLATNGVYYVQWPTVGTNSAGTNAAAQAWWYTVHFERDGRRYWTGDGRLYIEPTTSTAADGLNWQEITAGAAIDTVARAQINIVSQMVDDIEVGEISSLATTNTIGAGTTNPTTSVSSPFGTVPISIHNKGGAILLEREYAGMNGSNAFSMIGYDQRLHGRASIWLNGAWAAIITNYQGADINFGKGPVFDDYNIHWTLSSRPVGGIGVHDSDNRFALFQSAGLSGRDSNSVRYCVFPNGGHVMLRNGGPGLAEVNDNATLTVKDGLGESYVSIESTYTQPTSGVSTLSLDAGSYSTRMVFGGAAADFSLTMRTATTNTLLSSTTAGVVSIPKLASGDWAWLTGLSNAVLNSVTGLVINGTMATKTGQVAYATVADGGDSSTWSEYPATQAIDLDGNTVSGGAFVGDGSGLTNLSVSGGSTYNFIAGTNVTLTLATTNVTIHANPQAGGGATTNNSGEPLVLTIAATTTAATVSSTNYAWYFAPGVSSTVTFAKSATNAAGNVNLRLVTCTNAITASGFAWPSSVTLSSTNTVIAHSPPNSTSWIVKVYAP